MAESLKSHQDFDSRKNWNQRSLKANGLLEEEALVSRWCPGKLKTQGIRSGVLSRRMTEIENITNRECILVLVESSLGWKL